MRIEKVSFTALLDSPLLKEYAAECSIPEIGEIKPSEQIYAMMESAQLQQCFAAYLGDELIGFANLLTTIYPHYSVKEATLESIFVAAEHRKLGAGTALKQAVKQYAKEAGCQDLLSSAPKGSKAEQVLSKTKGARAISTIFIERL